MRKHRYMRSANWPVGQLIGALAQLFEGVFGYLLTTVGTKTPFSNQSCPVVYLDTDKGPPSGRPRQLSTLPGA
jgi:hypothetical protein